MKFKNTTNQIQMVQITGSKIPIWKDVNPDEIIDLPEHYGKALGFEEVKESEFIEDMESEKLERLIEKPKKAKKKK